MKIWNEPGPGCFNIGQAVWWETTKMSKKVDKV